MDAVIGDGFVKRMGLAAWNLAQAMILLYGLGIMGYLAARFVVGERWSAVAFADNFIPWWALGGLVLGGIAMFSRFRWPLIALQLPGVVVFVVLYGPLLLPHQPPHADGPRLTAATYNTLSIMSNPARVVDVIARLDADLVGLQELGPDHAAQMAAQLAGQYPYQALHPALPVHGVGLLSRYPILEETVFSPLDGSMLYMRAVLDVHGVPLTVYVVHPPPPGQAFSPLTYDAERRDAEIAILREQHLAHESGPLLVLGDFNMTDQSHAYRTMDRLLDDAFRTAGRGLGFTFPGNKLPGVPAMLRIDYIWYNTHLTALDARTWDSTGSSDHYPVTAAFALWDGRAAQSERSY